MKVFLNFLKLWITIDLVFSVLFWIFLSADHSVEDFAGIIGLTFMFSLIPAGILLVVLIVTSFMKGEPLVILRFVILYATAAVTLFVYERELNYPGIDWMLYVSVYVSFLVWTRSLLRMTGDHRESTEGAEFVINPA
jgi:hypothetical protein